jgi:alkaline phosphatase/2',3'-cyclic-nucleotide 2'-phosphodiesterase (5'-nucleotidase family)
MGINPDFTLLNASVDGLGNVVTLYFGDKLDTSSIPALDQFAVLNGDGVKTITGLQVVNNQVILTLSTNLDLSAPVKVSYTAGVDTLQNIDGQDALSFHDATVTNALSLSSSEGGGFSFASTLAMDFGAEISAFDAASSRIFVTSPYDGLQVVALGGGLHMTKLGTIDLGSNKVNSVAVSHGIVAVAVEADNKTDAGTVWFLDAAGTVGDSSMIIGHVTVGALPDMLTFSADGTKVLVANEGEMAADGSNPEGSISIIDLSGGVGHATVATASFAAFNSQIAALKEAGVRLFAGETGFESTTVAHDLEPEYISISPDGTTAFVTLQENNAIAILDIASATFTNIAPLGLKSFLGLPFDGSDKDGGYKPQTNLPVFGQYMPDAIASFTGADGHIYYVIANEGDDRDDFITPDETAKVSAVDLDNATFPNEATLKSNAGIGPLKISNAPGNNGDTDGDGDIDQLLSYGARSFSILNEKGVTVFDSGSHIEQFVAQYGLYVNANGSGLFDDTRSDNKGPEPEGVTIGVVDGKTLAFVTLERGGGGVMVYDVTNPAAVSFVQYLRHAGDESPEGVLFVSAADSPTGRDMLLVSNEVSNTVSIFQDKAKVMVTEVNSKADGGDFFELHNYGDTAISLDGWKWVDSAADFNDAEAVTFSGISIDPGNSLVVVNTTNADAFRSAWGISKSVEVVAAGGAGLGKDDAVVLFDANGKVVASLNYSDTAITASDGTLVAPVTRDDGHAVPDNQHAGVAMGAANETVSAVWDGHSTEHPEYTYAVAGELGAVVQSSGHGTGSPGQTAAYTLQILHFSDAEAGLLASQTAPNLAALVDKFEDDYANSITLAGGDDFIPGPFLAAGTDTSVIDELNAVDGSALSPTATVPIAAVDIAMLNAIGVEASALGNHEFDLGSKVLKDAITPATTGADFPYISANLDFAGDADLRSAWVDTAASAGLELASGYAGKIVPSAVLEEGGEKIGLVGATTQLLRIISSPSGTVVDDGSIGADNMALLAAALQPVINDLIAQGVNKIILLSHLQLMNNEKELAGKLSGVDIILAAGSHTRLGDSDDHAAAYAGHDASFTDTYPLQLTDKDGNATLIVSTDNEYTYLGRLVVDFDVDGHIVTGSLADNIAINGAYAATTSNVAAAWGDNDGNLSDTAFADGTRGAAVASLTDAVQAVISTKDGNVFGYSNVYMEGERTAVRSQETNLGDISADANAYAAKLALGDEAGSDTCIVSLKNGGGIRAQIGTISAPDPVDGTVEKLPPTGNTVSLLDVENSLRFNNQLIMFDTTAEGLKAILEHGVAAGILQGRFPQIGGVEFSWDPDLPVGSRVSDIALVGEGYHINLYNDGVVLNHVPETISMVTLSYLANGGDGYPMKANGENFRYITVEDDGSYTHSTAVDEGLDLTLSGSVPGGATVLGEQSAFETYMGAFHATANTAYDQPDTPASKDLRIQNMNERAEDVLIPVTASSPIADVTVAEDAHLRYIVTEFAFSEIDSSLSLHYTATLADGTALPEWLHFDAASHTLDTMAGYFLTGGSEYRSTDSASAITALVTGYKTDAGNIAWKSGDLAGGELTTIAETLRAEKGFAIGVASTVPFSHATPAGVVSHDVNRNDKWDIANEILTQTKPDVVIGGGLDSYFAKAVKDAANNSTDLDHNGYNDEYDAFHNHASTAYTDHVVFVERQAGVDGGDSLAAAAASVSLADGERLFGLYGTASGGNFDYYNVSDTPGTPSVTRGTGGVDPDPTLSDVTHASLSVLNQDKDGFFIMIEQGDIDWSNHANDFENMVGGVSDLDKAVTEAENYVASAANGIDWSNTLVIVTSDHSNSYMRMQSALGIGDLPAQSGASYPDGEVTYSTLQHTDELVTVSARGAGSQYFADYAGTWYAGTNIIDNTQIYQAMMDAAEKGGAEHIVLFIGDGMNVEHEIAASRYLYGTDFGLSWDDWGTLADGWTGYASTWDVSSYNTFANLKGAATYNAATFDPAIGYDVTKGGTMPYPVSMTFTGTPSHENVGTLEIKVTATDENGATASQTFALQVEDNVAPTVESFTPTDSAKGVGLSDNIIVTFDEAIRLGDTAGVVLHKGSVDGATMDAAVSVNGSTLMVDPTGALVNGTGYYLTFADGSVLDLAGNAYHDDAHNAYHFSTVEAAVAATGGSSDSLSTGQVMAGVAGLGLLAWLIL